MGKDTKKKPAGKKAGDQKIRGQKADGRKAGGQKAGPRPEGKKAKAPARPTALPIPAGLPAPPVRKPPKSVRKAESRHLAPLEVQAGEAAAAVLESLWQTVETRRRAGDVANSHSARLIARGTAKVAQKLGEEAVECVIEATQGHRAETILESADLLYHLIVVWVDAGIRPAEVWAELRRREGISGIAEKAARPRGILRAARTTKLP